MQIISFKQALQHPEAIFIDTRTPKEFAEDHLPRAINLPIFSNEERAIVGTMYKQISREKAIEQGIAFFSQKLPHFMQEINKYKEKELIIYCWRGGMRSKSVVSLLHSLGYNVKQLEGGHKTYRAYVRERLQNFTVYFPNFQKQKIIVLWGLTCTGKTELVRIFSKNSIDLEGLAQHRGSLYGAIGLQPRSQKAFENLLLQELNRLDGQPFIIVEGESRKIGDVQIPAFFYKAMLQGRHILITRSIEKRAEAAVKEYFVSEENLLRIKEVTKSLFKVISKKKQQEVLELLEKKEFVAAAKILLEFYYDPLYSHTLKKMNFVGEVKNENVENSVSQVNEILKSV